MTHFYLSALSVTAGDCLIGIHFVGRNHEGTVDSRVERERGREREERETRHKRDSEREPQSRTKNEVPKCRES